MDDTKEWPDIAGTRNRHVSRIHAAELADTVRLLQLLAHKNAEALDLRQRVHELEEQLHAAGSTAATSLPEATAELSSLYSMLMQAPIALCVLQGPEHVYSLVNEFYVTLMRADGRQLIGRSMFEVFPELRGQALERMLDEVHRTGQPYFGRELSCVAGSGADARTLFLDVVCQPGCNQRGDTDGILVICTDVSEKVLARRQIEETAAELRRARDENARLLMESRQCAHALQQADSRKDEFIATLAHELRNPLAPIRNGLHILRNCADGDERERVLSIMESQLMHMVRLIDDLLDISRIKRGRIGLRREPVSLQTIMQSAIDACAPAIKVAGHTLSVNMAEAPIRLSADVTRLTQVVSNLLNNAVKYTPRGGRIDVDVRCEAGAAVVTVADNGIGIEPQHADSIFDLFTQVDGSAREAQSGLGIGLALVRHLVEMHGGSVSVASAGRGCGSCFTVRLPLAAEDDALPAPCAKAEDTGDRRQKILIVDDDVASAQTIAWMLELSGYSPVLAHDGPQTLRIARQYRPDTILLDIGLPGMNGYDVCRELRSDPAFEHTVIIAQTGWGQKRDREMAMAAGFDHHLVKPISYEDITRLLSKPPARRAP